MQAKVPASVSLHVDGEWLDITKDVRMTESVGVERGRRDWADTVDPSQLRAMRINAARSKMNPDVWARYNPKNPRSDLYGRIGKNSLIRVCVGEPVATLRVAESGESPVATAPPQEWPTRLDMRIHMTPESWTDGMQTLVAQHDQANDERTFLWRIGPEGTPQFFFSTDGTDDVAGHADEDLPSDYEGWLRVTVDLDTGADETEIAHWISDDAEGPWELLGEPVVIEGSHELYHADALLEVGSRSFGSNHRFPGDFHRVIILDADTEEALYDADFTSSGPEDTQLTDSTGAVWTVGDDAEIVYLDDRAVRFVGGVRSWPTRWVSGGHDRWIPIEAAGPLHRLQQGHQPLGSAMFEHISTLPMLAYWPLEGPSIGGQWPSAVDGPPQRGVSGFWAPTSTRMSKRQTIQAEADDSIVSSGPLPVLGDIEGIPSGATMMSASMPGIGAPLLAQTCFFTLNIQNWDSNYDFANVLSPVMQIGMLTSGDIEGQLALNYWQFEGFHNISDYPHEGVTVAPFDGQAIGPRVSAQQWDWNNESALVYFQQEQDGSSVPITLGVITSSGVRRESTLTFPNSELQPIATVEIPRTSEDRGRWSIGHIGMMHTADVDLDRLGEAFVAWHGEMAEQRMERVAADAGIPLSITGNSSELMGPVGEGSAVEAIRDAAYTDLGHLTEARGADSLAYRTRTTLYDQPVALTLDYDANQMSDPADPVDDDQHVSNDITVSRDGGASRSVVKTEGTQSTATPPDGIGVYSSSTTVSLYTDTQLIDQAGWRLHLSTTPSMRWPSVTVDLHSPHTADIVDDVLRIVEGDRIRLTNLPDWLPPGDTDLIVQGWEETIATFEHSITFTCTTADPWTVARWGPDEGSTPPGSATRYAPLSTELHEGIDEDDELLIVPEGPGWTNNGDDLPLDIMIGGERIRVHEVLPGVRDYFDRTSSAGWGETPTGQEWVLEASGPSSYSISEGIGWHNVGNSNLVSTAPTVIDDVIVRGDVLIDVIPEGGFLSPRMVVRSQGGGSHYSMDLLVFPDNSVELRLSRFDEGSWTRLSENVETDIEHSTDQPIALEMRAIGDRILGRAWDPSVTPRRIWQVSAHDDVYTSGRAGFRSQVADGVTNERPINFGYSFFTVSTLQTMRVERSINDVVKAHEAGAPVELYQPAIRAL